MAVVKLFSLFFAFWQFDYNVSTWVKYLAHSLACFHEVTSFFIVVYHQNLLFFWECHQAWTSPQCVSNKVIFLEQNFELCSCERPLSLGKMSAPLLCIAGDGNPELHLSFKSRGLDRSAGFWLSALVLLAWNLHPISDLHKSYQRPSFLGLPCPRWNLHAKSWGWV